MSPDLQFQGTSVEKAVTAACQQLDVKEKNLKYEIITHGSTGIFGLLGAKKAKIKVYIQEKQFVREKSEPDTEGTVADDTNGIDSVAAGSAVAACCGKKALQRIVDGITEGTRVITSEKGKRISYNLEGGKPGVLIGKRGQTLDAIQYIVEKVVNRNSKQRVRVSIDVGGYLANKKQNLENLASETARKAKKSGRPATIGQLNAHDRRIIHLALKNDKQVVTKSVGDGFIRKLVVLPKNIRRNDRGLNYKE